MELTVRKEDLVKGLGKSQSVVERRTSMPILSNVLLEAEGENLTVAATDLETSFHGMCAARVTKPGKVTVPARKLYEIVKELPAEEIYLKEKDNNYLQITAGRANFSLVGLSAEDFPNLPQVEDMPELSIVGRGPGRDGGKDHLHPSPRKTPASTWPVSMCKNARATATSICASCPPTATASPWWIAPWKAWRASPWTAG